MCSRTLAALIIYLSTVTTASSSPSATVDAGVVIGTTTSLPSSATTVNKFLGIPFAAPPVRFTAPQKPKPWSEPLDTKTVKPACIQQFVYPKESSDLIQSFFNNPAAEESEDCLYLNVFAPATPAPENGRAVMFWIYGGALQFGHGGHPVYDGSKFASGEDVIVVTHNYRTNVFGFPSSPELPLTGHNLGWLDQRFALDWVQRNIHAFGGNPNKVTVFGESAGAWSTDALLTSYPANSKPPFRAAILQSGQISYHSPIEADTTSSWLTLAAALNCSDTKGTLECIRVAPAATIKTIVDQQSLPFWPVPDNVTLIEDPVQARVSGNIARIPILSGTNAQESRIIVLGLTNTTAYLNSIGVSPDAIPRIEAAYPIGSSEFPTAYDAIAQMATDYSLHCPDALLTNATATSGIPAWRYYFNASFPNTQFLPDLGVFHASELWIVFGTYPLANATAQEAALSNYMRETWARFAKYPVAGPGWNAVGTGSDFFGGAGDLDIGLVGSEGSAGVEVIRQAEVDSRCSLWVPILTAGS
ncbi:alpha/beta-hydrolase [Pleomassaria siparia CBS 279.74]|uniref:Carboxylic ester hydrolase n=1 Tax=Pleomassaria siparia CBS 279.74 TaxID=1314801 RepID=A0A6G1KNE3_9PLEO|nr:alpha/beta-hydrolase [Pleomassaria siparia CBS 279.74]